MVLHDVVATLGDLLAIPNPEPKPIPGLEGVASDFISWLRWLLMIGGVAGLLICGIMMAVGRRNRSAYAAEGASGIPWVIGGLALGMVATSIVAGILPWF
jgi:hypothetical protein